eukprot:TRINITY_DN1554_c0_g1_i2.p1 TRINITY_DN1554_c0_g1~~TRINITY_DN1554_c0_g1_i2.p1  ORF type:complete len:229 (-),score=45.98 TRINITY_DN1554_c0_g1_i2:133-819(-)
MKTNTLLSFTLFVLFISHISSSPSPSPSPSAPPPSPASASPSPSPPPPPPTAATLVNNLIAYENSITVSINSGTYDFSDTILLHRLLFSPDCIYEDPVGFPAAFGHEQMRAVLANWRAVRVIHLKKRYTEHIMYSDYLMLHIQMSMVGVKAGSEVEVCHYQLPMVVHVTYGNDGLITRYRSYWDPREYMACINGGGSGGGGGSSSRSSSSSSSSDSSSVSSGGGKSEL